MIEYTYQHRVRYRECDPMGVVYHTHYIDYFEVARTEALREQGLVYKSLEEKGIMMPVIDLGVQYKRPAHYDDLLLIKAVVKAPPKIKIRIDYEVQRAEEPGTLVTGHVTLCFVNADTRKPIFAPSEVTALFDNRPSS